MSNLNKRIVDGILEFVSYKLIFLFMFISIIISRKELGLKNAKV